MEMQTRFTPEVLQAVLSEILNIRKMVPLKIRRKLNVKKFNGTSSEHCVWGQMYGEHDNKEAMIMKPKVMVTGFFLISDFEKYAFHMPKEKVTKLFSYLKSKGGKVPTIQDLL